MYGVAAPRVPLGSAYAVMVPAAPAALVTETTLLALMSASR